MSRSDVFVVRRNVAANIAGSAWAALMSLAFVPVYVHFLGIEAYGLIGIFLSLTAILALLDLGLGTTLNRELARRSVDGGPGQEMRDLLRTFETVYWIVGALAGLGLAALAPLAAGSWVQARELTPDTVERTFVLMGLAIACQWPLTLYNGGLAGMQRQVALNAISIVATTVRNLGAAIVLWRFSGTIEAFFGWMIAVGILQTLATAVMLWRVLPRGASAARFEPRRLREVWRFAAGMTGISAMSVVLTQLDKVILSKVLPLEAFGYYSLAWRVASCVYYLVGPVGAAFFPRYSQLVALNEKAELARLYHKSCQLLAVLVLPVAAVLALFPAEFLRLWTQDATIAAGTSDLLALLVIGAAINGIMNLPLLLQLAHGWTRLALVMNIVNVLLLAPAIYLASVEYGGTGAAWVWIALNCGYLLFMLPRMHRRLLPGELRAWFLTDVGRPLVAALAVAAAWKELVVLPPTPGWTLLGLCAVSALAAAAAALAAPQIRALILHSLAAPQRSGTGS